MTSSATWLSYPPKSHWQTHTRNVPPVTYTLLTHKLFHLPVMSSHRSHFSFPPPGHPLFHPRLSLVLTCFLRRLSYTQPPGPLSLGQQLANLVALRELQLLNGYVNDFLKHILIHVLHSAFLEASPSLSPRILLLEIITGNNKQLTNSRGIP